MTAKFAVGDKVRHLYRQDIGEVRAVARSGIVLVLFPNESAPFWSWTQILAGAV